VKIRYPELLRDYGQAPAGMQRCEYKERESEEHTGAPA
jgi:hypothetical protein